MSRYRFTAAFLVVAAGVLLQWRSPELFGRQFDFAFAGLVAASMITGLGEIALLAAAAAVLLGSRPLPGIETALVFSLAVLAWFAGRLLPWRPAANGTAAAFLGVTIFYAVVEPTAFIAWPGAFLEDAALVAGVSAVGVLFLESTYPPERRGLS